VNLDNKFYAVFISKGSNTWFNYLQYVQKKLVGIGQTFAFRSRTPQGDYPSQNLHAYLRLQTIHPPYLFLLLFGFIRDLIKFPLV